MKVTRKRYKKSIAQVLELFKQASPLSPLEKKERVIKAKNDFWFFMETYLPHYMEKKSPKFHKEIILLADSNKSPLVIGAPRGFSKSTLLSFAFVIWNVLREKYLFIILISATDILASDLSEFIQIEFIHNKRLIQDFGELYHHGTFKDFFVHKTRILARGRKQSLRGFKSREHRPDLIILDDIEKDDEAHSPKIVSKTLDTITRGILPSLKPNGKLIIVGTILQRRSVMGTLLLSKEEPYSLWAKSIFKALVVDKGKEKSIWPSRFTTAFLKRQKRLIGISAFNAEYQNLPMDNNACLFKESFIKEGTINHLSPKVIYIDPSVDGIKHNDYKAAVLVAKDSKGMFEVVDAVLVQGSDLSFFEQLLSLYKEHEDTILGTYIESNSFQVYYMKELDNFAKSKGVDLRVSGSKHYQKKELRIARILPLFETDKIVFNPTLLQKNMGKLLVEQLLYFPNSSVHDDAPDALAGAIEILSKIEQQLSSSYQVLPKVPRKFTLGSFDNFRKFKY